MDEDSFEVINNLLSDSTTNALSAKQGKVLKELIDGLREDINNVATDADIDAIFTA